MIGRMRGSKKKILPELLAHFPQSRRLVFVDLFMGSGVVSMAMAKLGYYVIANDINNDVYNLFMVLKNNKQELWDRLNSTPYSDSLFDSWKENKETDPVWRAVRFLCLVNFSMYGCGGTMSFGHEKNAKQITLDCIRDFSMPNIRLMSKSFDKALSSIANNDKYFYYADPPYPDARQSYASTFTCDDWDRMVGALIELGQLFAISDLKNSYAHKRSVELGLYEYEVKKILNVKNHATEMLFTNYEVESCWQQLQCFE